MEYNLYIKKKDGHDDRPTSWHNSHQHGSAHNEIQSYISDEGQIACFVQQMVKKNPQKTNIQITVIDDKQNKQIQKSFKAATFLYFCLTSKKNCN